jgi:ribosomal protein S12 methylthiotransferase accessory factor
VRATCERRFTSIPPSFVNPPLQIPVVFGHWLVRGDRLECRLPRKVVTVRAPRRLLSEVMELCDGSRSWKRVVGKLSETWSAETIAPFMLELANANVVVESTQLWAHWSDVAQIPEPTRTTATDAELGQLPVKAQAHLLPGEGTLHPRLRSGEDGLTAILKERKTSRTFSDAPISAETLCSILWAAHGVAGPSESEEVGWHRTTGSAGNMHSARWFVAVLRDLPSAEPSGTGIAEGMYEAAFHVQGGASLRPLPGRALNAWRCLSDPRVLRFASAVVFPVYDVAGPGRKYGNRATLFASIEAGQCMQNAQLMAVALGAGCAMRGDTVASEVLALAGLHPQASAHWLPMPGLVFGLEPSPLERRQQTADKRFRVAPNLQPPTLSGAGMIGFATTPAEPAMAGLPGGSGRASDPRLALTKAEAEAWERLGWATAANLVEAPALELPGHIPPQEIAAYSRSQYASRGFPFGPFVPACSSLWRDAVDSSTGKRHPVLAEFIHPVHSLPPDYQARCYTQATSSGVAAGTSAEDALARATLELIERDAFLCSWLRGHAPASVSLQSMPKEMRMRIVELRDAGLEMTVLDISTPWSAVLAVFAQTHELPFTTITAAASLDPEEALRRAIEEAEGRFAQARASAVPPSAEADAISQVERYYRSPRTYRRSDFFVPATQTVGFGVVGRESSHTWDEARARMHADGFRLLAVDLTPAKAAIHQGRAPLHVVRAIVPGLVPIWFQRGTQPQGMHRFRKAAGAAGGRPAGHFVHPFT